MSFQRYKIRFIIEEYDGGPIMELIEYTAPSEDYKDATERLIEKIREEF